MSWESLIIQNLMSIVHSIIITLAAGLRIAQPLPTLCAVGYFQLGYHTFTSLVA